MTTDNRQPTTFLYDGPAKARHTFLFAHGAGGAMDTPFMNDVARGLGERGIRVVRFEFPYMAARRTSGKRGAPDRQPVLLETFRRVIDEHGGGKKVAVGGKSMGGRMASMVADEAGVRALVCFGYPFHPPGKPEQVRTAHLEGLRTPALILQGTRDPFGTPDDVAGYRFSPAIRIEWLAGGDHSLKGKLSEAIDLAAAFLLA
ncbi:MAG TPA: alpha/beta family hydrolase [Thermoanaerobaculia bacterium]|nr:alpha/beta family hydrolase [Thermoanaerobaculia bacterium]